MIITSVKLWKQSTYEVVIDDRNYYLHRDIVADYGLSSKREISEERFEEIMEASEKRKAFERGLYLLDYRDYSYKELFEKLSVSYEEDICFYVTDRLAKLGMIDDRRYAENLARKLVEVKKYGPYRASQEMYRKGLDRELINEVLEKYSEDTVEMLYELIMKKYSNCLDDRDRLRKMKNALARLGYSFDDINRAVRMCDCHDDDEYY